MTEDTRNNVEAIKKGEHDKRKKVWEDKDGPPNKKHKKMTAAQEEKGNIMSVFTIYLHTHQIPHLPQQKLPLSNATVRLRRNWTNRG